MSKGCDIGRLVRKAVATVTGAVLIGGLAAALFLVPRPALAAEPAMISVAGGYFDVFHRRKPAAEATLEYRSGQSFFYFHPIAGIMGTSDHGGYVYAGVMLDIPLFDHIWLTPSIAPGLYAQGGGKHLGYPVEFRSQIEVSYRFSGGSRLGVTYSHMSNAGLGHDNPGVEIAQISYAVPFDSIFGN